MPAMIRTIPGFVDALSRVAVSDRACNPYARGRTSRSSESVAAPESRTSEFSATSNAIRRANLRLYLEQMRAFRPRAILVGEAPSHRGARLTGIPFMSERLMLDGVPSAGMFGVSGGYRKALETETPSTEASATIIWSTIREVRPLPLLWNAFPFHPHHAGNPRSNRMPTSAELLAGEPFLEALIRIFDIPLVIAVGNHAERSLARLGIAHTKVRHPSQGGKPKFVAQVRALFGAAGPVVL